jgi:hypothetical protein
VSDTFGTASGLSRPFGTPWLALCDTLRLVCFACFGVGVAGLVLRWAHVDRAKRLLMVACAVYSWSAVETEWDKLGSGIGIGGRLWVNVAASLLFAGWVVARIGQVECG